MKDMKDMKDRRLTEEGKKRLEVLKWYQDRRDLKEKKAEYLRYLKQANYKEERDFRKARRRYLFKKRFSLIDRVVKFVLYRRPPKEEDKLRLVNMKKAGFYDKQFLD